MKKSHIITGSLVILVFFLLGAIRGVWPTESRATALRQAIEAKAQEYARVAETKRQHEGHCAISKELEAQLLLLHGEAERMRSQIALYESLEGKKAGTR